MTCNFSLKHYQEILEEGLSQGYRFIGYEDLKNTSPDSKVCILRHDVDYMPEWAIHFGTIESTLNIQSTFFFQIGAKTYNLRETTNHQIVQDLKKMGHTLGIHYDPDWNQNITWDELPAQINNERNVFKSMTGISPCEIISFHNPHRFIEKILSQSIPGIRHTYENSFFSSIRYLSDSQGWYEGCMCQIFKSKKYSKIQLLLHPDYWPEQSGDFIENIANLITFRKNELLEYLLKYHPVCKKNETRLRDLMVEISQKKSRGLI